MRVERIPQQESTQKKYRKENTSFDPAALCYYHRTISLHPYNYHKGGTKLQALVYDILPSTTALFSYIIGSRKLSADEQFTLVLKQ